MGMGRTIWDLRRRHFLSFYSSVVLWFPSLASRVTKSEFSSLFSAKISRFGNMMHKSKELNWSCKEISTEVARTVSIKSKAKTGAMNQVNYFWCTADVFRLPGWCHTAQKIIQTRQYYLLVGWRATRFTWHVLGRGVDSKCNISSKYAWIVMKKGRTKITIFEHVSTLKDLKFLLMDSWKTLVTVPCLN